MGVRNPAQEEEELDQSRLLPCRGDHNSKGRRKEKEAHLKSVYTQEFTCFLKLVLLLPTVGSQLHRALLTGEWRVLSPGALRPCTLF